MRVGCPTFASTQGIAHIVRDFHRAGIVNKVMVFRHRQYHNKPEEFYPDATMRYGPTEVDQFLQGLDVLLLVETDLSKDWMVARLAKQRGIKVVLSPMYEYSAFPCPIKPDLVLCPSLLDLDYYAPYYNCKFLPIPVDMPWRLRERALTFCHNAGHGQHGYAKGTLEVIEAMEHVKAPIRLKVRAQLDDRKMADLYAKEKDNPRLEWELGDLSPEKLYDCDVMVNAEQWNGCSLPLQEACASGCVVMTGARYPATTWLPSEPLIPVDHCVKYRIPGGSGIEFDRARYDPLTIAAKIDEFYGRDVSGWSCAGKSWAEANSWVALRPKYLDALEALL